MFVVRRTEDLGEMLHYNRAAIVLFYYPDTPGLDVLLQTFYAAELALPGPAYVSVDASRFSDVARMYGVADAGWLPATILGFIRDQNVSRALGVDRGALEVRTGVDALTETLGRYLLAQLTPVEGGGDGGEGCTGYWGW